MGDVVREMMTNSSLAKAVQAANEATDGVRKVLQTANRNTADIGRIIQEASSTASEIGKALQTVNESTLSITRAVQESKIQLSEKMNMMKSITAMESSSLKAAVERFSSLGLVTDNLSPSLAETLASVNTIGSAVKEAYESMNNVVCVSMMDSIATINKSISSSLAETLRNYNIAMKAVSDINIPSFNFEKLPSIENIIPSLQIAKISNAVLDFVQESSETVNTNSSDISYGIADKYNIETQDEKDTIAKIKDDAITFRDVDINNGEQFKRIVQWFELISYICGILSLLLQVYSQANNHANSNQIVISPTVNIFSSDIEDTINNSNLYIINRPARPRAKSDCSSQVVGNLEAGTVVWVNKKYRKWIKVSWKDPKGYEREGWIQNYYATKIKYSRQKPKTIYRDVLQSGVH